MCLLIKEQRQKHLTWPARSFQKGTWTTTLTTGIYRPQRELKNLRCERRLSIHGSLGNFLLSTFRYCLCPHSVMSVPHRHSQAIFRSDNTLFFLVVSFVHSASMYRGCCVSPGAEQWKYKDEWGIIPILSTLSMTSFIKRRATRNWWGCFKKKKEI